MIIDFKKVEDALNFDIDGYVADYEVRGDDGDYLPNEHELFIVHEIVEGLLEEFSPLFKLAKAVLAVSKEMPAEREYRNPDQSDWNEVDVWNEAIEECTLVATRLLAEKEAEISELKSLFQYEDYHKIQTLVTQCEALPLHDKDNKGKVREVWKKKIQVSRGEEK